MFWENISFQNQIISPIVLEHYMITPVFNKIAQLYELHKHLCKCSYKKKKPNNFHGLSIIKQAMIFTLTIFSSTKMFLCTYLFEIGLNIANWIGFIFIYYKTFSFFGSKY